MRLIFHNYYLFFKKRFQGTFERQMQNATLLNIKKTAKEINNLKTLEVQIGIDWFKII